MVDGCVNRVAVAACGVVSPQGSVQTPIGACVILHSGASWKKRKQRTHGKHNVALAVCPVGSKVVQRSLDKHACPITPIFQRSGMEKGGG